MPVVVPEVMSLQDLLVLAAVFLAAAAGLVLVAAAAAELSRARRRPARRARRRPRAEGASPRSSSGPSNQPARIDIEAAAARHIAMELLDLMRSGRVRVAMKAEGCPGEVVVDLNDMRVKCLDEEHGILRRLGEPPAGPEIEETGEP